MMRRGRFRRQQPTRESVNSSAEDIIAEEKKFINRSMSHTIKKPFRCLVGIKDDDWHAPVLEEATNHERYVPPGENDSLGFEATYREKPSKQKQRKKSKSKESLLQQSVPSPHEFLDRRSRSYEEPPSSADMLSFSRERNRSFEEPPSQRLMDILPDATRNRSSADSIVNPKKSDALDYHSIRDVTKALREMERKLNEAETKQKRISRSKVMKALLTVVNELDEEYDYNASAGAASPRTPTATGERFVPSRIKSPDFHVASPYRVASPNQSNVDVANIPPATKQRPVEGHTYPSKSSSELYRKWAIPPPDATQNRLPMVTTPPRTKKESTKKMERVSSPRSEKTASTRGSRKEPKPVRDGSLSRAQASVFGTQGHSAMQPWKRRSTDEVQPNSTEETADCSSSSAEEDETLFSEESSESRATRDSDTAFSGTRGSFAEAVFGRNSTQSPLTSSFDIFNMDLTDFAVQDALRDLMWIPMAGSSPLKTEGRPTRRTTASRPKSPPIRDESIERPYSPPNNDAVIRKLRKKGTSLCDEELGEECTSATTRNTVDDQGLKRDRSWWRRTRTLEPSMKDTPNVSRERSFDERNMKVTVTTGNSSYPEEWKDVLY